MRDTQGRFKRRKFDTDTLAILPITSGGPTPLPSPTGAFGLVPAIAQDLVMVPRVRKPRVVRIVSSRKTRSGRSVPKRWKAKSYRGKKRVAYKRKYRRARGRGKRSQGKGALRVATTYGLHSDNYVLQAHGMETGMVEIDLASVFNPTGRIPDYQYWVNKSGSFAQTDLTVTSTNKAFGFLTTNVPGNIGGTTPEQRFGTYVWKGFKLVFNLKHHSQLPDCTIEFGVMQLKKGLDLDTISMADLALYFGANIFERHVPARIRPAIKKGRILCKRVYIWKNPGSFALDAAGGTAEPLESGTRIVKSLTASCFFKRPKTMFQQYGSLQLQANPDGVYLFDSTKRDQQTVLIPYLRVKPIPTSILIDEGDTLKIQCNMATFSWLTFNGMDTYRRVSTVPAVAPPLLSLLHEPSMASIEECDDC